MTDPDDLDVRALFERAMQDSPPPVDLDVIHDRRRTARPAPVATDIRTPTSAARVPDRARRRWVAAASLGLVAAAVVAIFVVPVGRDEAPRPAVEPPAPTASTTPDRLADERTTTSGQTTPTTTPTTTVAPGQPSDESELALLDTLADPPVAVTARAAEVERRDADGSTTALDIDATEAHAVGDGRVFAALASGEIVEWHPDDDSVDTLVLPDSGGPPRIVHDVAEVAGVVTVLFEQPPVTCDVEADACDVVLYAFEPDTGELTRLVTLNGARSEWSTLSLAETGIVIGSISGEAGIDIYSGTSGADVVAAIPQPGDLGLTTSLVGCDACPQAYTIDRTGTHLGWLQGADLVVIDLDVPSQRAVVPSVAPNPTAAGWVLEIADVVLDGAEVVSGVAVVSDRVTSVVANLADDTRSPSIAGRVTLY